MKKPKGQTIDLLYTSSEDKNKKKKNAKKPKKRNSTKKGKTNQNETINLNNEIIIGLTPKIEEKPKKTKNNSKTKKRNNKINQKNKTKKSKKTNKTKKEKPKTKSKKLKFVKWIVLIILLIIALILFLRSSVFNIKEIVVLNNNRVSSEQIITLSELETGTNMFKLAKSKISKNIKANPYVEKVKIKRGITGTVTLDITERVPTYMLKFSNAYVYINNQGYMLEISETPLELPIITGFSTDPELIKEGNRLSIEDLVKLEDVIKITESAKLNSLANLITQIDITNSSNYILILESEEKKIQFGECRDISMKMLKIEALLEQEKGNRGEIYFQDSEKTIFREETNY